MGRAAASRPGAGRPSAEERALLLGGIISELCLAAARFVAQARVEETVRHWLAGGRVAEAGEDAAHAVTDALVLALDLALFTPAASGATAIDRLARQHRPADADGQAALAALRQATFRILRVEGQDPRGGVRLKDLATGERSRLIDPHFPAGCEGLAIAGRMAALEGDLVVSAGPVTPLDEAMLAIAQARMRPGGGGLTNPNRCAEAIYRHAVRFGAPEVAGVNRMPEGVFGAFPFAPADGPMHALAVAWAGAGADVEPAAADVQAVRELVAEQNLLEALTAVAAARELKRPELAAAYDRILAIQLETIDRRAATGLLAALASLDAAAALIDRAILEGLAPAAIRLVFDDARRRVRLARPRGAVPAGLDKVLARIQALRAKTVDRGCTEAEAIAAAAKIAELLDRHGLSLGEIELKSQACEGFGIGTGRRRMGPIDLCVPTVGGFCDCRVWTEQGPGGEIRYVFFGLPADVAGARYLHERVERAFDTETERFKRSELYAGHRPGDRRSATRSFQTGLAHGIVRKLQELRERRDAAMRTATGRDLVPVKQAVIDDELAKLGLSFHRRGGAKRSYVLEEAYQAGHAAGRRFEHRPGIGSAQVP